MGGNKMFKKISLIVLSVLMIFTVIGCSNVNQGQKEVTLRIGFQTIPNTEAIAKASGWHEENITGVDIQWVSFDSGRDVNTALASGSIDIGVLGSTLVATGIANGIDYKVIWLADVIGANEALVVKKDRGIETIDQLRGKKIAVTFGSTTQYTLLNTVKLYGIQTNEVTIVDMQPPDMLAAWKRGDIDAGFVWQPTLEQMVQDNGKVLIDSGSLIDKGIITADVIVVRTSFAIAHPEIVTAYIESQLRAVELYQNNPDVAAEVISKDFSITKEMTFQMMQQEIWLTGKEQTSEKFLGGSDQIGDFARVLADTALFLNQQGFITSSATIEKMKTSIDPSYILKAQTGKGK